jgi:diguanylate cyclase (GGDEF)-like protein/PAS domain S-box-containing protein
MDNGIMDSEKLYLEILNNIDEGAYFANTEKTIMFWNKAAEEITGYKQEELLGKGCQDTPLKHIDGDGNAICNSGCPLHSALIDGQQRKHSVFLRHKEGHRVPISVYTIPVKVEGEMIGAIEIFTLSSLVIYDDDLITQLSSSALNDRLTGIPNRRKVESYLTIRLREMSLYQTKLCVAFLDIDNFREFNNNYGHNFGDAVLKTVSEAITHMIRNKDLFGRWGGEEFIGIFAIQSDDDVLLIGEKIRSLVEETVIRHDGVTLSVTVSVGVAVAHIGDTIESIVRKADKLMYQSKQSGRNCVTVGTE